MKIRRKLKKINKKFQKISRKGIKNLKKSVEKSDITVDNMVFSFLVFFSMTFMLIIFVGTSGVLNPKKEIVEEPSFLEMKMEKMVAGHPLEEMVPYIVEQNEDVAKYLFAISKKESNWGKLSPEKGGETCYNYWGYRGSYNKTDSGYSCFDDPAQAVRIVSRRIKELINQGIETPQDMVVWKCGRSCVGHGDSAQKWIDDVEYYYQKL